MSFFGKLFGKSGDKDATSTVEAIEKLSDTEEMLMKKVEFLEKKILSEVAIFKMDIIKSYHVNYYQCQLSYQGWKDCKLVGGFNDRKDRR